MIWGLIWTWNILANCFPNALILIHYRVEVLPLNWIPQISSSISLTIDRVERILCKTRRRVENVMFYKFWTEPTSDTGIVCFLFFSKRSLRGNRSAISITSHAYIPPCNTTSYRQMILRRTASWEGKKVMATLDSEVETSRWDNPRPRI